MSKNEYVPTYRELLNYQRSLPLSGGVGAPARPAATEEEPSQELVSAQRILPPTEFRGALGSDSATVATLKNSSLD